MIINSHVHLATNNDCFFYNDYGMFQFVREMLSNGIHLSLPSLNPKLPVFRCPHDCSFSCPIISGKENNNLNKCNCNFANRHRVCIHEKKDKIVFSCKTCGKVILESSIDPLRKYNIDLINLTKPIRAFVKPILYLALCRSTLQKEINFFEQNFNGEFVGFKFHPWNDQVNVSDFRINASKPILIHTGKRCIESAQNAINFAKKNPNVKIVIAHAASLDKNILKEIAKMQNVFIDCCPSVFMFENRFSLFDFPQKLSCPEDIYYFVLNIVPSDKILFGTDSPWGNTVQELAVIRNLKISTSIKEKILHKNAEKLYLL